ncbi:MAG: hypothetical protein ACEQSB_01195 [Undibacterium sp.]
MGSASTIPSIYINSYFAVERFNRLVNDLGRDAVEKNKIERERVIGAMFFITLSIDSGKEYFLRVSNLDGADVIGAEFIVGSDGRRREELHNLEIVEFVDFYPGDIFDLIKSKLKKAYPDYYSLLCYVNRETNIEVGDLARAVAGEHPRLSSIWIMSNQDGQCIAFQIYPTVSEFKFNLLESLGKQRLGNFYKTRRGSGKGDIENLGLISLPFGSSLE